MRGLYVVLIILIVALSAATYLLYPKPQPKSLTVRAWTDQPEYFTTIRTNQYCRLGGYALLKVYSDIKNLDGSVATNSSAIGQLQLNGSKFGGEMQLHYNSTSQLWESDWSYFGCMQLGNFNVNITAIDGNNAASGIYQFSVRENK